MAEYCAKKEIDVLFVSGSYVKIITGYFQRHPARRIAKLLSNTCEKLDWNDARFLAEKKIIDFFSDHLMCGDGGAAFITCRNGVKHLLDYAGIREEENGRLISTDFFSLASPFIRYWNGDTCSIGRTWQQCGCGRYYREFEIEERRKSFVAKNSAGEAVPSINLYDRLSKLQDGPLLQLVCSPGSLRIISSIALTENQKASAARIFGDFRIVFSTGDFVRTGRFDKWMKIIEA